VFQGCISTASVGVGCFVVFDSSFDCAAKDGFQSRCVVCLADLQSITVAEARNLITTARLVCVFSGVVAMGCRRRIHATAIGVA
jgi:tryptophanyl-tRNA synthetase